MLSWVEMPMPIDFPAVEAFEGLFMAVLFASVEKMWLNLLECLASVFNRALCTVALPFTGNSLRSDAYHAYNRHLVQHRCRSLI